MKEGLIVKKKRGKSMKEHSIPLWVSLLGIILTFAVGSLIGPFMQAWFSELLRPKPVVYFLKDECCIVPALGTHHIFCKTVIRNDGQEPATPLSIHIEVSSPYIFEDRDKSFADFSLGGIRPGQSLMQTFKVTNPDETVEHGSLTVHVRIENTYYWDEYTFSESW
jgi:hypothetical protein